MTCFYSYFVTFSTTGESAGHFYPIPVHTDDLSAEFDNEALPSLAERLWSKFAPIRQKFHKANNSSTTGPTETAPPEMTYAPSDIDKRRSENIKRNNDMLR